MKKKKIERFSLAQDNDGHSYIIPASKREAWGRWLDKDSDEVPIWAAVTGCSPTSVTFTDPIVD